MPLPSPRALTYIAAALVAHGDQAAAALAVERIRRIAPGYTFGQFLHWTACENDKVKYRLCARLWQAGLS
ncbi:MAG: hypothetical protein Q7T25_03495 [Sideroxyarcus sp.]|nr:hypothetical protein [Sideroxyarcus sp.]